MIHAWLPLDVLARGPRRSRWIRAVVRGDLSARVDPRSGEWFVWTAATTEEVGRALDDPGYVAKFTRSSEAAVGEWSAAWRRRGRVVRFPSQAARRAA